MFCVHTLFDYGMQDEFKPPKYRFSQHITYTSVLLNIDQFTWKSYWCILFKRSLVTNYTKLLPKVTKLKMLVSFSKVNFCQSVLHNLRQVSEVTWTWTISLKYFNCMSILQNVRNLKQQSIIIVTYGKQEKHTVESTLRGLPRVHRLI